MVQVWGRTVCLNRVTFRKHVCKWSLFLEFLFDDADITQKEKKICSKQMCTNSTCKLCFWDCSRKTPFKWAENGQFNKLFLSFSFSVQYLWNFRFGLFVTPKSKNSKPHTQRIFCLQDMQQVLNIMHVEQLLAQPSGVHTTGVNPADKDHL